MRGTGQPTQIRAFPNAIRTTMTVPANGRFEWHVNPSARPSQYSSAFMDESWVLRCTAADGTVLPGRLVNGAFSPPQPLRSSATSPAGTGTTPAPVGGSAGPTPLLTWPGPVSNAPVTVAFKQAIGAGDALRTGTYSKTLTFTLSTTNP